MTITLNRDIPREFFWLSVPEYEVEKGELTFSTTAETDFWQRTHYGFSRDNGHALLHSVSYNFMMTAGVGFEYQNQFDQCGLMVRIDALNWIKVSVERDGGERNRLGTVATNLGYSDWASSEIESSITEAWFRVRGCENDFCIESSFDGRNWSQVRITHLLSRQRPLNIGLFACSPGDGGFKARFSEFNIERI